MTIEAPMTKDLQAAISAVEVGRDAYLLTSFGKPFVIGGLDNKMREWCDDADLPQCSSHGLRKAAAVALAESGASASELMAIFGWTNLKTAQIYVEKANKRRMTANAFERRERSIRSECVSLSEPQNSNETNEEKAMHNQRRNLGMVGDERLELPTSSV